MKARLQNLLRGGLFAGLMVAGCGASAGTINFIALTEDNPGGLGESAWNPLVVSTDGIQVTITGKASDNDDTQFAYLDWGNAGLGVCPDLTGGTANTAYPDSGSNICHEASDDNVTTGESLEFVFDKDVVVENLWFNNNHDGGFGTGDKVTIDSGDYALSLGVVGGVNGIGAFTLSAGEKLIVAYNNEEFYVSGMEVRAVPVPAAAWLFGSALMGLAGVARRRSR